MFVKVFLALVFFFSAFGLMFADQISVRNGSRLVGDIISSDAQTLSLLTSFAGRVSIQWDAIEGVSSTQPLYVRSKSGQTLVGTVSSSDNILHVETVESGAVSLAMDAVISIRSKNEELKAQTEEVKNLKNKIQVLTRENENQKPSLLDNWSGTIDSGFLLARGNSGTTAFNVSSDYIRSTERDVVYLTLTSLWAQGKLPFILFTDSGPKRFGAVTASFIRGNILYLVNFKKSPFAFVQLDLEHDRYADVGFRALSAIGMGYHAIRSNGGRTQLDLMGGVGIDQYFLIVGSSNGLGDAVIGDKLRFKISKNTEITQDFRFLSYFRSPGQHRISLDTAIHTDLSKWLNWHIAAGDRFMSIPPLGTQRNDLVLLTGLGINFGQK